MKYILFFLLISLNTFAANTPLRTYHLTSPDEKTMDAVADEFEVTRKLSSGFEVLVPESKLAHFLKLAPKAQAISIAKSRTGWPAGYRNINKVNEELKNLALKYPDLAKLETYGKTDDGHVLYVLKVSDNVTVDENEPELMITAATHGDEIITVEVEMELINQLLQNYGKDQRLTKMISEREIFFIPVVNPQGYENGDRYANDVDPNRDYPYPDSGDKKSVDCIDAIRKFFHSRDIKGSIDLHAFGELIMYPWAYTRSSPPQQDKMNFDYLTKSMAEVNKYTAGQISKVIYVAKGSSADYYYWKHKTVALGIELTNQKAPSYSSVPKVVEESREMIWRFIEHF